MASCSGILSGLVEFASTSDENSKAFGDRLRDTLGPPIQSLHQPVDQWLSELPMTTALYCALGLYLVAGLWIWSLRKDFIFRGAPERHWRYDLRIWATIIMLPYMGFYWWLGL